MKVLVAGAAGFLGSHVCEVFAQRGAKVVGIDNCTYFELRQAGFDAVAVREYMLKQLAGFGTDLHVGNIVDADLRKLAKGCDLIINCAAQPTITLGFGFEAKDALVNVVGTVRLLDAARDAGAAFINCSTIHVYGNGLNRRVSANSRGDLCIDDARYADGVTESWPVQSGDNMTSLHASKLGAEHYCTVFQQRDGVSVATFRLTGMYGPRQFGGPDHGWMANMAIRAVMERPITVFKPAGQVRDVLYATDAVDAMWRWFAMPSDQRESGIFNIGGGNARALSIRKYLEMLAQLLGTNLNIMVKEPRPYDLHWFVCDVRKASTSFGWEPEIGYRDGTGRMLDWIQAHRALFEEA